MTTHYKSRPIHPGIIFKQRVIDKLGLSISQAADYLGVSRPTMSKFCSGSTPCTQNLALRIASATGSSVTLWINLQAAWDGWVAEKMTPPQVTQFPRTKPALCN